MEPQIHADKIKTRIERAYSTGMPGPSRLFWLCLSGLASLVAFMSQIGPDDAVSNLSKWVGKLAVPSD
jgi:hypothetical protein